MCFVLYILSAFVVPVLSAERAETAVPEAVRLSPPTTAVQAFLLEAKSPAQAQALYREGCEAGEAAACAGSGASHEKAQRLEAAKRDYQRACTLGDGYGCYRLGQWAQPAERKTYWTQACQNGIAYACFLWGTEERNAGADPKAAFKKGCENADLHSCNGLGLVAQSHRELDKAKQLFEKVCEKRADLGCNNLGLVELELGNISRAASLFETACNQHKDFHACNSLGIVAKRQGRLSEATKLYQLACDNGVRSACRNLVSSAR